MREDTGVMAWIRLRRRRSKMINITENYRSRDRAVGIATGYGLDDRGVGV
jgi:hypothetical protein